LTAVAQARKTRGRIRGAQRRRAPSASPYWLCRTYAISKTAAEDGKIAGLIPQSVVFEIAYVLQSQYGLTGQRLATTVRAVLSFRRMRIVDDCSWKRVLEIWPETLAGLADAAIVAVAAANRYEAVATFDRKLSNRVQAFGLAAYW
jgi:predicted nucleic-acid-binding protein